MKSIVRPLIPNFLLFGYQKFYRYREQKRNSNKAIEEVFTEIYEKNKWGGTLGEFCSGSGTTDGEIVSAYVSVVFEKASTEGFTESTFVDLGCGDFSVGKQLLPLCSNYIGVDIVKPLINRNREKFGSITTKFLHLDIVKDELPDGDVCFIRQVLQHLSNSEIINILQKLEKYKWVFITEHYPDDKNLSIANIDKSHGSDVRVYDNSGVYLTMPPFSLPPQMIDKILEVPGTKLGDKVDSGLIRTFLYKPRVHSGTFLLGNIN